MGLIAWFQDRSAEREIRHVLRSLARQRVRGVLQPGTIWLIERVRPDDENSEAAKLTCLMRGWIEILHEAVPSHQLGEDLKLPSVGQLLQNSKPIYKLTEGGWAVINRDHMWIVMTFFTALLALIATVVGMIHV